MSVSTNFVKNFLSLFIVGMEYSLAQEVLQINLYSQLSAPNPD